MDTLVFSTIPSPAGDILAAATDEGVCLVHFSSLPESRNALTRLQAKLGLQTEEGLNRHLELLKEQLNAYFSRQMEDISIPLVFTGTDYQESVWRRVMQIPYGRTVSYSRLAEEMGQPGKLRALAAANAANPLLIVVPCHRVVGKKGQLTGYAGGMERKLFLLELEQNIGHQSTLF